MRILPAALLAACLVSGQAFAAEIAVTVRSGDGQPVKDAVATFTPSGGRAAGPIRFDWPMVMAQENISFAPYVLIVPQGADVAFPNHDKVRHHVYSFSPAKRFELKLYGREEKRTVTFDKTGTVALGCNIHDEMVGFIRVVDTPYAAKTDAAGHAVLGDVPTGGGTLTVWQPFIRAPDNQVSKAIAGPGPQVVVVELRAAGQKR